MSDAKENDEAGQSVPSAVEENQQLVDAQVEAQPEVASAPVTIEETPKHVENGSNDVEKEKAEPPAAEDKNVKPDAVSEGIPQDVQEPAVTEGNPQDVQEGIPQEDVSEGIPQDVQEGTPQQHVQDTLHSVPVEADAQVLNTTEREAASDAKMEAQELPQSDRGVENGDNVWHNSVGDAETAVEVKPEVCEVTGGKTCFNGDPVPSSHNDPTTPQPAPVDTKPEIKNHPTTSQPAPANTKTEIKNDPTTSQPAPDNTKPEIKNDPPTSQPAPDNTKPEIKNDPTTSQPAPANTKPEVKNVLEVENKADEKQAAEPADNGNSNSKNMFFLDADHCYDGNESGTEEEQSAFMKELENFFRERSMEFKPPKFYGEGLNCLKLWRAVTRLGGYDKVTSCKLWRQVGESFKPPKTCTTVSWTFRGFYEKALLDYERHKIKGGELNVPIASHPEPMNIENQASASGRARRDAAARAMQGWHSQRLLGNGEVSDPIIKDRNSVSVQKREKQLKNINLLKRKKPSYMDNAVKAARSKPSKPQLDTAVVDIGPPADWVKINVQKTKDCFEVYALVPGLLREEVRVQSDPAGRLVISGEPEHPNNPWGVTPFKKVVSLPSRIDPHQTSAVVTLHGQLFVRVPFEQSE